MYAKFNIYYKLFIYESGFFTLYRLIKTTELVIHGQGAIHSKINMVVPIDCIKTPSFTATVILQIIPVLDDACGVDWVKRL